MTMPNASARNTATSDTRWKRKLITEASAYPKIEYQMSSTVTRKPLRSVWIGWDTMTTVIMAITRGHDEQREVESSHAPLVELADALRVDEHRPEAEAGEERRRHPLPALVEELDHRRVGPDRDDQLRAAFRSEQHRDVLARALGHELCVLAHPTR